MKKSLIALLVVLALIVSVSVFSVSADEPDYTLTITGGVATAACPCETHNGEVATFTEWTGVPSTSGGHYYLSDDYSQSGQMSLRPGVLHLNGHTLQRTGQGAAIGLYAGKHFILDNPANEGGIKDRNVDGSANSWGGYGGIIQVANANTTLNIYGGTYAMSETTRAVNGAVIGISNAANVVNIYGGVYEGVASNTSSLGGAIGISAGTLNLYGGTIQNSTSPKGGAIYATGTSSKIVVDGGTITGCSATDRGGSIALLAGASLEVKSGTITGGSTSGNQMGGNIYSEGAGKITISGGEISNGYTWNGTTAPTAVYDENDATKVIGYSNSTGAGRGGNIIVRGSVGFEMTGGTISGGSSPTGGNISFEGTGTYTTRYISGGTVTGGFASSQGGNFYLHNQATNSVAVSGTALITKGKAANGGNVSMASASGKISTLYVQGGTISSGTATNTCGGVYVGDYSVLDISDGTITANTSKYGGGNIRLTGANNVLNVSGGTISNGVVTSGDGGNLACLVAATINITGGNFTGGTVTGVGANVAITNASATSVMKNATISGGTSSKTNGSVGAALYLSTANFTEISGMTFGGGKATGSAANGGGVLITTGSYTIKNSTFTGGQAYANGGALQLATSGTTTLEGCTVSGGIARYGANIYLNAGTLNLVDTDINKCGTGTVINGGAIWVGNATVNMDADSTITGSAAMHGGQVFLTNANAVFNLNGGTISNGTATRNNATVIPYGGNVAILAGTFNMNSGTISGGKLTNGSGAGLGGNVYVAAGTFNMVDGTISGGTASTKENACGGNVYIGTYETSATVDSVTTYTITTGSFVMTDGTISGGTAQLNGGNIYVAGVAANADHDTAAAGATLDINGGELTGGTAVTGGSIYIDSLAGSVTINDATISGGKATSTDSGLGGGNIWNALGTTTITDCTIENGVAEGAQGGNIFNKATGLTVTGCRIVGGTAGIRTETETTDDETGESVITYSYPNTNGRGGNYAQVAGSATFTNCVILNGTSYSGGGGGGNVYVNGTIGETTFNGCTITGGHGQNQSGNLQHHAVGTVVINGDSYIAEGWGGAWGANIGVTNGSAVLKIDGNTEINATGCSTYGANGINIHIAQANAKLYLLGNSRVVLGSVYSYHSIVWASPSSTGTGKIYLGGNAFMDKYIELKVSNTTTATAPAGCVEVMEGFTGDILLITFSGSNSFGTVDNTTVGSTTVNFGGDAPAYLTAADGYANTGTIKVHSTGRSGYVVSWTGEKFVIAPYTAFVAQNNGAEGVSANQEIGLSNLTDTLPTGTGYVKLYTNTAIALNQQLDGMPIDLNNQTVTIDTNGYTLAPIDYRTDGGTVSRTALTVTGDESEVTLLVTNPVTGYRYLNVKDAETGIWTSNRIRVEMTKVSIRPSSDGIYYTTKIQTNANAATYMVDYGTAVSLVNPVDENFLEDSSVLYTSFKLNSTDNINITTRSAIIAGIVDGGTDDDTNGRMKIYANSYATAMINGNEVKIMADKTYNLSLYDVMVMLDEKVAELHHLDPVANADTINAAVAFYNKWDVFATWGLTKLAELAA